MRAVLLALALSLSTGALAQDSAVDSGTSAGPGAAGTAGDGGGAPTCGCTPGVGATADWPLLAGLLLLGARRRR